MQRELIITDDGSSTIWLPEWNEAYHSTHGAIQEARHVFMRTGLFYFAEKFSTQENIHILEIGFGTGLNAFMTFIESKKANLKIDYTAVEAFPVSVEEVKKLNYSNLLSNVDFSHHFLEMHKLPWEIKHQVEADFQLTKQQKLFQEIDEQEKYDLLFFDAFSPQVQPELWTEIIFEKMYKVLKRNGVLVTYSAKGSVRRAMQSVGFTVERLPGPPGKREMLRATKEAHVS